jgi:hypothetical protein
MRRWHTVAQLPGTPVYSVFESFLCPGPILGSLTSLGMKNGVFRSWLEVSVGSGRLQTGEVPFSKMFRASHGIGESRVTVFMPRTALDD